MSTFGFYEEAGEAEENADEEFVLEEFRDRLAPGMPVHVSGLVSRPDLEGKAGFLDAWLSEKGRWRLKIGAETLLIRPQNLFP